MSPRSRNSRDALGFQTCWFDCSRRNWTWPMNQLGRFTHICAGCHCTHKSSFFYDEWTIGTVVDDLRWDSNRHSQSLSSRCSCKDNHCSREADTLTCTAHFWPTASAALCSSSSCRPRESVPVAELTLPWNRSAAPSTHLHRYLLLHLRNPRKWFRLGFLLRFRSHLASPLTPTWLTCLTWLTINI